MKNTPMHVVVANLTSGGMSGGGRKYLEQMVPLLHDHPRVSRLDVVVPPGFENAELHSSHQATMRTWAADDEHRGFRELRKQLSAQPPDVLLIPAARVLRLRNVPTVIMMRNMEPPLIPFLCNPLSESVRNVGRVWNAKRACQACDHVIAVSDFVQRFLFEKWRVRREKVTRIYHGIEAPFERGAAIRPTSIPPLTAELLLFTAGSIRPARGLEDLIVALARLKQPHGISARLLIAGSADHGMSGYRARLQRLANSHSVDRQIHWLGALNAREMSWCYYNCSAFVMTSRAEACPNVALEAMSHGAAIISVDNPPMPEFFPSTCLYYSAGAAHQLAEQIKRLAHVSSSERARWQAAAVVRATDFSWRRTAQDTVALLRSLVRGKMRTMQRAA